MSQQGKYPLHDIVTPHEHDVLSGRGNFVNYHAGNEHFRALVRKHKVAYVACPKPQKGKFSRLIVDEIRARNPPGRFLKQDASSKLWHDIGEKKALDKTRQALREGAPEISKELTGDPEGGGNDPNKAALYGMNDGGLGGYGAPELKNEPLAAQHAALSMMQQQQRMQTPQQQLSLQMMSGASQGGGHPGSLYSGQLQRLQQQQQQQQLLQQKQQQQLKLQQQSLSRHLGGGGQLGGLGSLGGLGGMGGGGMGGMGVNPYANFQNNDYDDLEPTPLDPTPLNARNPYGQMSGNPNLQAQLQAQAQLQVQSQQLQQLQQRQQLQNQGMAAPNSNSSNPVVQRSSLKDGSSKGRPGFPRENSEQSLQLGNAFEDTIEHGLLDGTGTDKNKQKMGNSSAHMSIMSLTVSELDGAEDVGVAGDLSSMFDSSLQISDKRASHTSSASSRRKSDDVSKAGLLDMSVATIGNETVGGLSSALGGDIEDSQAHMESFSHMFDESEKTNL